MSNFLKPEIAEHSSSISAFRRKDPAPSDSEKVFDLWLTVLLFLDLVYRGHVACGDSFNLFLRWGGCVAAASLLMPLPAAAAVVLFWYWSPEL